MPQLALQTTTTLLAVFALSWRAPEAELAFAPAADSRVRRTFDESTRWRITELSQVLNGEPVAGPTPEISGSNERKLIVLDHFAELGAKRPARLVRKFEELRGESRLEFEVSGMQENVKTALASALEGTRVEFTCGAADAPCKARFAEDSSGGDGALLDGLAEDLDLRALLPSEDVGVEDRWTIDASRLSQVLAPGGQLALNAAKGSIAPSELLDPLEVGTTVLCALSECSRELDGEVEAVWVSTRAVDGRALAAIELEWESSSTHDASKRVVQLLEAAGSPSSRTDIALEFVVASEGTGTLVWDLAAGRAHSFELELDSTIGCEMLWSEGGSRMGYRFTIAAQSKFATSFEAP